MARKIALGLIVACGLAGALEGQTPLGIPAIVRAARGAVVLLAGTGSDGTTIYQGTGFLIRADGVVATNYHVIAHDASALAKLPNGAFYRVSGVLAADPKRDIAILKLAGSGFRTLTLGNSDEVQVGQAVVAIGNPLSLESTVSSGIISGVRDDPSFGGRLLQITAPISHGSSGGPVFDMRGRVIGVTVMYLSGGEDLNFAVPINDVRVLLRRQSANPQPLPAGSAPQAEPTAQARSSAPASSSAGCTIDGSQRTREFCQAYATGYVDGAKAGFQEATVVMRPQGRLSLYVEGTVSDGDGVGADFVYALRSEIASSPLYSLASDASSAEFEIEVVTVAPDQGTNTAGAVVIECGGSPAIQCAEGKVVGAYAFVAGSAAVGREARDIMGGIDQTISALPLQPAQQP